MKQRSLMKPTMNVLYVRIQLYLNFTELQLKSLCGLRFSGKCFSSKFKSIFPTFTISNLLKAGMNDKILIYHCFYWVLVVIFFANFNLRLQLDLLGASWYIKTTFTSISSFKDILECFVLIMTSFCLISDGECFHFLWISYGCQVYDMVSKWRKLKLRKESLQY